MDEKPFWNIVVPVWDGQYIGQFVLATLPAIRAALAHSQSKAKFLIYTDVEGISALAPLFSPQEVSFLHVHCAADGQYQYRVHEWLGIIHRSAIRNVETGTALAMINADMVPSLEVFGVAERQFALGRRLIMCAATRTMTEDHPPIGASSRQVLDWTWDHRHPWISDCIWGSGRTRDPALIYFDDGHNVIAHGFHLHPFAFFADGRRLDFLGYSIDDDFPLAFRTDEIHVVTDADEMAFAEVSRGAQTHRFRRQDKPMTAEDIARWARRYTHARHRWLFGHPIVLRGHPKDLVDKQVCHDIVTAFEAKEAA